jgi:hypothetical protein
MTKITAKSILAMMETKAATPRHVLLSSLANMMWATVLAAVMRKMAAAAAAAAPCKDLS